MINLIKNTSDKRYVIPHLFFNPKMITRRVMFLPSCKENIFEYEEIFSVNYFSIRKNCIKFVWRYNRFEESIDLYSEVFINDKKNYVLITRLDFLKEYELSIKITNNNYIIQTFLITSTSKINKGGLLMDNKHKSKITYIK